MRQYVSKQNRALLSELVRTDFKLRYQGSALGYAWSLLRPLLLFVILYVVFVKFLKLFYNAMLRFSGSLFVTSNAFFMEIMLIQNAITMLSKNSNIVLVSMVHGMQEKFDKYILGKV